jgi:hypothetical protein
MRKAVGIAGYGLNGPGFEPPYRQGIFLFSKTPKAVPIPHPGPDSMGTGVLSQG